MHLCMYGLSADESVLHEDLPRFPQYVFHRVFGSVTQNWKMLLGLIENRGKVTIKNQKEFMNSLDDAKHTGIKAQPENLHRWRGPRVRDPVQLWRSDEADA